jgi:site-specific DNA recombinase
MARKLKAAAYMRYSSAAQDDGFSIEAQQRAIREFAIKNNIEIVAEYIDKAKSGTNANRPAFQRLFSDCEQREFEIVIVHNLDRFARNALDSKVYRARLKEMGIALYSLKDDLEDTPNGKFFTAIKEAYSELYSDNLSQEVKKGLKEVALRGLHTGGSPPLGYDVVDRKLVINESEAEIVRTIFKMFTKGQSYNDIAKELNAKGYTTRAGNEFSKSSFNAILQNRKYIGEYIYNRRVGKDKNGKHNSHKNKTEEEIIRIHDGVPKIIDTKTFNAAQKRLSMNKRGKSAFRSNSTYLLAGLIKCGECGFSYQGNTRKSGKGVAYSSYRCGKRAGHADIGCNNPEIEKHRLENFVIEQVFKYLFTDEGIKEIVKQINAYHKEMQSTKGKDIKLYQKQLKALKGKQTNIARAIANGADGQAFIEEINKITQSINDIEQRIEDETPAKLPAISEAQVKNAIKALEEELKSETDINRKKEFINAYVESVVVCKETVEVTLKVASNTFANCGYEDTTGALLIHNSIERNELKTHSKQKKKTPKTFSINDDKHFTGFEIVNNPLL